MEGSLEGAQLCCFLSGKVRNALSAVVYPLKVPYRRYAHLRKLAYYRQPLGITVAESLLATHCRQRKSKEGDVKNSWRDTSNTSPCGRGGQSETNVTAKMPQLDWTVLTSLSSFSANESTALFY